MAEISYTVIAKEKNNPGLYGPKGAIAQAYGLFNMAFAAGALVGPIWAGFVEQGAGWATMTWTLGLLSGVSAIPAVSFLVEVESYSADHRVGFFHRRVYLPQKEKARFGAGAEC